MVEVPGDGGIAWVAKRDLRAGTAKLLTLDDYPNYQTVLPSGGAYTVAETAEIMWKVVNNRVVTKIVPRGDYVVKVGNGRTHAGFAKLRMMNWNDVNAQLLIHCYKS